MKTPEGKKLLINPGGSETYFEQSNSPGNYLVSGKGTKTFEFSVAVNFPKEESIQGTEKSGILKYDGKNVVMATKRFSGKYLRDILVILLIFGILIEGEVYRRGL